MSDTSYDCPEMIDLLVDYLDGELSGEKARELEGHLALCPPCVKFVETYKQTGKVCRQAIKRSMPPALKNSLLGFLRSKCSCSEPGADVADSTGDD